MFKNILFTAPFIGLLITMVMVDSAPTNPHPFQLEHDGGKQTPDLFFRGSGPHRSLMTDTNGYTVIQDRNSSRFVYAMRNDTGTSEELVSSGIVVGEGDPAIKNIPKRLRPSSFEYGDDNDDDDDDDDDEEEDARRYLLEDHRELAAPSKGQLYNLIVLVRFSNHVDRDLPTAAELEIVFNHEGNHPEGNHELAPTGSVRDFFQVNSRKKLTLDSKVYGWVDLPETEAYYANGQSGFATKQYMEALHSAMNIVQKNSDVNLSEFDGNDDGKVDLVTLVHSGYAAENYGTDPDGVVGEDRIWSHHRKLPKRKRWYGNQSDDVCIYQYGTVSAFFGEKGSDIARIGVISHEIGHALGLPDLYGSVDGNGIGSYDLMSNHWGFPTLYKDSQIYPPILSAWTKMKVGWVEPILINNSGTFIIEASQYSEDIYRINMDEAGTEYLLIENRQAVGFDSFLPQGGLAIWHIDETASNIEGYPGQNEGGIPWPFNQQHYKVSLLQADGAYDLENARNNGDKFDLFHADGVDFLAPSFTYLDGPHPNTDSYKEQMPSRTGTWINQISKSGHFMSFNVNFMDELSTIFAGGNGAAGTMFDLVPTKDINIRKLYLNLVNDGPMNAELWSRTGTHVGFENKPLEWQRNIISPVDAQGSGKKTSMDVGSITLKADTRYAFYVVVLDGKFRYTNGNGVGNVSASNEDLTVYEGAGLGRPFNNVYNNRIWNGSILYNVISSDDDQDRRRLRGSTSSL